MTIIPSSSASGSLAPGFRFHPTDEELVRYYLRRKICGKPFKFDAISDIDIYKLEPWDLPDKSKLKSRDLEWYFFSTLDKKYGNSSRTNRATLRGYWKTTGKDRAVYHRSQIVGMKKTLVYHIGRAPRGERTNWVMHEYRLVDTELEKSTMVQKDALVLCRIFHKSGPGPKNGERYGAPFVEEDWESDELEMVSETGPKTEPVEPAEEVEFGVDDYLDGDDLEQILGTEITQGDINTPLPLAFYYDDRNILPEEESDDRNILPVEESDDRNIIPVVEESDDRNILSEIPRPVKHEYIREQNENTEEKLDYLLDEPFFDPAVELGSGAYLETDDLANPIASFDDMLEEYLTFHDTDDIFDLPKIENVETDVNEEAQGVEVSEEVMKADNNFASSSKNEKVKLASECEYPYLEQASKMLGNIQAPPAFASEFPKKESKYYQSSMSQPSSSVHVTAGIIQIRNTPGADLSFGKHGGGYNLVLSFNLSYHEEDDNVISEKALSRGFVYFLFLWVLVLSVSFKIAAGNNDVMI